MPRNGLRAVTLAALLTGCAALAQAPVPPAPAEPRPGAPGGGGPTGRNPAGGGPTGNDILDDSQAGRDDLPRGVVRPSMSVDPGIQGRVPVPDPNTTPVIPPPVSGPPASSGETGPAPR
jgi:hypothetical protein